MLPFVSHLLCICQFRRAVCRVPFFRAHLLLLSFLDLPRNKKKLFHFAHILTLTIYDDAVQRAHTHTHMKYARASKRFGDLSVALMCVCVARFAIERKSQRIDVCFFSCSLLVRKCRCQCVRSFVHAFD